MPANPDGDGATEGEGENRIDGPIGTDGDDPGQYVDVEQWVQVHQTHYAPDDGKFVAAVVSAVAEAKGVDPLDYAEMPPLYESFDTETLEETFFDRPQGRTEEGAGTITFTYNGYTVAVRSDGWMFVYEPR